MNSRRLMPHDPGMVLRPGDEVRLGLGTGALFRVEPAHEEAHVDKALRLYCSSLPPGGCCAVLTTRD